MRGASSGMANQSRVDDRAATESPTPVPSFDSATGADRAEQDPPSFPQQQWDGKAVGNSTHYEFNQPESHADSRPKPSSEQTLDALQCIFHQMGPSIDGAATSLNAVLQGPYFDDDALMQLTGGATMDAYVINMALRSFNLSLQPANSSRGPIEPHLENAFLIFQFKRWTALRRVGAQWLNLSERVLRPVQILPWQISLILGQLQDDGCEVYVVRGQLPRCAADENKFFEEEFRWCLDGEIMAEDIQSDCCDGAYYGECTCYDFDETYEDELQAAIEASLADVQPAKPLTIKTSPPTSLISAEEPVGSSLSLNGVTSSQERDEEDG